MPSKTPDNRCMDATLKCTPLSRIHAGHGAKMVPFGGWDMPLQFSKVLEEHHAVRNACGLFDISHMGLLSVHSGDATLTQVALDALVPQDLSVLYPGKAVYTQLLNPEGGIIDDIIVYWMPETAHFGEFSEWLVICNASNTDTVIAWLKTHLPQQIQIDYMNATFSLLALQGPKFKSILDACGLTPSEPLPKRFHIGEYTLCNQLVLLSRTGYTGEDGVEIIISSQEVAVLWETLLEKDVKPVGLAARDTLRLEAAYPLHGHELSEDITPLEAGLGWSVRLDTHGNFIGKAALLAQRANGSTRHFTCFVMQQKSIPRAGDKFLALDGRVMGFVTSGSISPTLDKPIGVGYIEGDTPLAPGTVISVEIRGNALPAMVVERPFYSKK